ncbi:MAG: 50S ribosomal protein L24 [Candidatus Protochlamydia sp.]|nr:50S ribosomal protein L24 [Candidatus Protochlamydia sp.]
MENTPSGSKKIRKGDTVVAITGNNRGQTGIVQSCSGDKVVVQGLNVRKKHVKRSQDAPKGRIVEIEKPIHISNLKVCVEGDSAVKLKVRSNEQGQRQFVYSNGDKEVVYRSVKKPK